MAIAKMYKVGEDGEVCECSADTRQIEAMKKGGWSTNKPEKKEVEAEVDAEPAKPGPPKSTGIKPITE